MQPVDQWPIYELGAALQQLKATCSAAGDGGAQTAHYGPVWSAEYQLDELLSGTPFELSFCRASAETLQRHLKAALAEFSRGEQNSPPTVEVPQWRWYAMRNSIDVFEHQFSAELKKLTAYAVPERGIFKTEALVDAAERHIHESVRESLPSFSITEFRAAGRCLAFGLYSASGFHSARAAESALREYHKFYLPKQNADEQTMGQMASSLEDMHKANKKAPKLPSQNTTRHMKDFVNFDRNPLMHKTVELEEIHAVTMFNAAASLIVEMAKELAEQRLAEDVGAAIGTGLMKGLGEGKPTSSEKKREPGGAEQPS